MSSIIIQTEFYSVNQVLSNPMNLYVFGDNGIRKGTKGQAIIRNCPNAFGIATKRLPSMNNSAFFRDTLEDQSALVSDLTELEKIINSNKYTNIIFPSNGLGTGLAKMEVHSPKLFNYMNEYINYIINKI